MGPRADADARRARGLLLALVLVVSQASAWFHAVAIAHVACPEHGEAMHGGAMHGGAMPADDARAALASDDAAVRADLATVAGHNHCANAALLRWRDVALTAPTTLAPLVFAPRSLPLAWSQDAAPGTVVYRLAPKTSPPSASV